MTTATFACGLPSGLRGTAAMEHDGLNAVWQRLFERNPPPLFTTVMMRKFLAYEVPSRELGRLVGRDRCALPSIANGGLSGVRIWAPTRIVLIRKSPGMNL